MFVFVFVAATQKERSCSTDSKQCRYFYFFFCSLVRTSSYNLLNISLLHQYNNDLFYNVGLTRTLQNTMEIMSCWLKKQFMKNKTKNWPSKIICYILLGIWLFFGCFLVISHCLVCLFGCFFYHIIPHTTYMLPDHSLL